MKIHAEPPPPPDPAPPEARHVFEILVREHADMLETYLRALMGSDPALDDVFQEAMMVAWRRLKDYDRTRPFAPWLRGIAQVLVMEHARKGRARARTTDPEVLAQLEVHFSNLMRSPGDTFRERADRLWPCVSQLPEPMREAVELVYIRGTTLSSAAESMGASKEALWKRVQRARQLLAQCLSDKKQPA
jgi:RNA polymerase sigma-70 factor (ECF subfamily)